MTSTALRTSTGPVAADGRRRTTAFAWLVTLTLSSLPMIVIAAVTDVRPAGTVPSLLVAAALLVACATRWAPARPLLPYLVVMVPVFCVAYVLPSWLQAWQPPGGSVLRQIFYNKTLFLLVAAVVAVLLVAGLRLTPKEAFLTPGEMNAPSRVRLGRRHLRWGVLGTAVVATFLVLFGVPTWLDSGLGSDFFVRLWPVLALVVGAAAFNALAEEVLYRAGPLATLSRVVGPRQAVVMTSVWFGLAHYFGSVPEGFAGVIQSGVLALVLGGAMVSTRGIGWPWLIHFSVDLVVFASIAAGSA